MSGIRKVEIRRDGAVKGVIAERCEVAERFMPRFLGLMGRSGLAEGAGVHFPRCNSIHMMFMRFPIDVVFFKDRHVTSVHRGVRPWRPLPLTDWKATDTLELPAGTADRHGIEAGDEVCIS